MLGFEEMDYFGVLGIVDLIYILFIFDKNTYLINIIFLFIYGQSYSIAEEENCQEENPQVHSLPIRFVCWASC